MDSVASLGRLVIPSTDIDEIIDALSYNDARIWVLNNLGQVLTQTGDIYARSSVWTQTIKNSNNNSWLSNITNPIINFFTQDDNYRFVDPHDNITVMSTPLVNRALKGFSSHNIEQTPDKKTNIISAVTPIWNNNTVMGVVVTEQTTLAIKQLRNNSMQQLINTILIVILMASLGIILFSASISGRIIKLRDHTK